MPRFAVLSHDHPRQHWDLLLEDGPVCRTWRLMATFDAASQIDAEQTFDHRLVYLDYEGPISGDRGHVTPWDRGTYEWQVQTDDLLEVVLRGQRWQGSIRLTRIEGPKWLCVILPTR